ncbi:uncharacterized protein LOC126828638 [Patella vulgata]|uniref:uncharacterized protein LOC126828638 n=1 Tax=Patella vulgata TaxID=6465 RepID=UPI00217F9823|nr:uncharacterized protein LOC126828638 [Patella vulgata]XP_050414482.1 uncharacterized protein LOC126828638 [Patella vulgata]
MHMIIVILVILFVTTSGIQAVSSKVNVTCGDYKTNKPAILTYTGDAKAVFSYDPTGKIWPYEQDVSTATFSLAVYYKPSTEHCYFVRTSPLRDAFCIRIETRKMHELFESDQDESFLVECAYMAYKDNVTTNLDLLQPFKPMDTMLFNKGIKSSSNFTVKMIDVRSRIIKGSIPENHVVKIWAHMEQAKLETGFVPLECMAVSLDGKVKMTILADGCGTGFPWKNNEGFKLNGTDGESPYFRAFKFARGSGMRFRCAFVSCVGKCDTNSCGKANDALRSKRSMDGVQFDKFGLITPESKGVIRVEGYLAIHDSDSTKLIGVSTNQLHDSRRALYLINSRILITILLLVFGIILMASSMICIYMVLKARHNPQMILDVKK